MKTFTEFLDEISKDLLHRYRDANYQAKDKLEIEKGLAWYKGQRTDDPREKFAHRVEFKNKVRALKKRKKGDELAVRALTRKQNESLNDSVNEDVEHPLNSKIREALRGPFERHNGEEVKGATLGDIKDHLEWKHGIKMGTRRIEDHIYDHMRNELKHEQGHSRSGWSRGGLNKRTPARFYHKGEKYEWSEESKKHIKTSPTYIRNKKKD